MTTTVPTLGAEDDRSAAAERRAKITLAVAALATLATFLDTTILYVAFPDISATFASAGASELSWVLNAYTIVFAALLVPAGKIADRYGHRKAFLTGSTVFTLASMACGLSPTVESLIFFRVVQATGAAILIPSSLALVMQAFPREKIPQAVAIWGAAGAIAGALGPTLGAAIVEGLGWRWAFYINLPVGIFTVGMGIKHLAESRDTATRVPSLLGVILIAGAAGLLSYGLVESKAYGWTGTPVLIGLVGGLIVLGLFVVSQRRTDRPALDLELFAIRNFSWGNLSGLAFGLGFSAMFFGSILFLTNVWGWSILRAGFGIAPGPALVAILAPRAGKLAGQIGQRPLLLVGGLLFAVGGVYRWTMLSAQVDYWVDYFPSMLLTGAGVALVLPQLSSAVAQALPANRIGVGGAVLQAMRQFGGTFGVALTVAFLGTPSGLSEALARFDQVWLIIVGAGLTTSALALPMRTRQTAVHGSSQG